MQEILDPDIQFGKPMPTQQLLLSVVIVCHNQAQYLANAIESVVAQTYHNLEILVVDDGSTDNTRETARRFSQARYLHQENQGLSAARNAGLRETHGPYVVFLDADDRLLPHCLEAGIECFRRHPNSGFVFGGYRNIFSDGSSTLPDSCPRINKDYYWHFLQGNFVGMHATVMYPRKVLEGVGGFNTQLRACEDYELYLRITRVWQVIQHNALIAEYRQHDANMSRDHVFMLRSVLRVLDMERRYIPDHRHKLALHSGINIWKNYYGNLAIDAWRRNRTVRGFLTVASCYPRGIAEQAFKLVRDRISHTITGGKIRLGSLRRLSPISRQFGFDRGKPVDRHYIESFLANFAADIHGQVLEIGDNSYSQTFGGTRITGQDVLHVSAGYPGITIVADLTNAPDIPSERFDCIVFTQTLHLIYDMRAALSTLARILKPGGILLATLPGISQICRDRAYPEADSWRFTASSARRLFNEYFLENELCVQSYGNVLAATAFLYGLATCELKPDELNHHDSDYPVILGVRARKADNVA
jgi:glycosyltransferase involved in cell wall biosynthesis